MTLQITYKELEMIRCDDLDGFEVIQDRIPYDSTDPNDDPMDYIEDDGRQYRLCIFKDINTGIEYSFNYIWHSEWLDFPEALLDNPVDIEFVKESVLYPPEPIVEPEVIKTPAQLADEAIMQQYKLIEDQVKPYSKGSIPASDIKDIKTFLKTQKFSLYQLREKIIPVCTKHKVCHKSFWDFLQGRKPVK